MEINFRQHLSHPIGLNHKLKKMRELEALEDQANRVLLRQDLLGSLGIIAKEKNGIKYLILTGKIKDDKEIFQRVSAAILKISEVTNINVTYGLEKREDVLIFRKPIQSEIDVAEYVLRYYPELNEVNIRSGEYPFSRFIVTGRILDDKESFEKFKAAIEQITEETDLKIVYGLRKEGKYLRF